tara:strand:+ start:32 stop:472 length:441 start_codon:yes stop_codon:yes gene_type:complete
MIELSKQIKYMDGLAKLAKLAMQDQAASANVGRAGEYLALSRLSLAGYFCTLAPYQDHDAYIQKDTRILTLQVKTSSKRKYITYPFHTKQGVARKRSDVYAFVAIDLQLIFWCRGDSGIIQTATTHLGADMFKQETMQDVMASFGL